MKKFLALILALVMTLSLAGCKEDVAIEEVPDDQIPGFTDQTDLEEPVVPISIETDTDPDDSGTSTQPAHIHSYTSKTVAATCTADGYTLHTCSCGDSYKYKTTKKLGHSYKDQVIAPTASAQGYTLHTCTRCGYSYKDNYTDKLSTHTHTWEPIYEKVPVYETVCRTICSTCGADLTNIDTFTHMEAHMLNGESSRTYERYDQVQVGTESQIIGYRCSGCGAEK